MRSLVEEHAHALVGELVAKAVLVGVVDPFGHPQKGLGPGQTGRVPVGCSERVKITAHVNTPPELSQPNSRPTCGHARQAAAEHFHSRVSNSCGGRDVLAR